MDLLSIKYSRANKNISIILEVNCLDVFFYLQGILCLSESFAVGFSLNNLRIQLAFSCQYFNYVRHFCTQTLVALEASQAESIEVRPRNSKSS